MIHGLIENAAGASLTWPGPVQAAMRRRDAVGTGVAMLESNLGVRALWTLDKRPIPRLTPHGVADATTDPRVLFEWALCWPDCELAVVPGDRLGVIDIDDAGVSPDTVGVPETTWTERTPRGTHHFVELPAPARKSKLPGGRGDFLTGSGAYVEISPSRDRWPVDVGAPILALASDSPLLQAPRPGVGDVPALGQFTPAHRREARRVLERLCHDRFGAEVRRILDGDWRGRYPSASERDAGIVYMSSLMTRDPAVLGAVLVEAGLVPPGRKRNPDDYLARTVDSALTYRAQHEATLDEPRALSFLQTVVSIGRTLLATSPEDPSGTRCDLLGHPSLTGAQNIALGTIVSFLRGVPVVDVGGTFARGDGWVRVPVSDIATLVGCNRKTVCRALERLEKAELVERDTIVARVAGRARADSLVRCVRKETL